MDSPRRLGVHLRQARVQGSGPVGLGLGTEARANPLVRGRPFEQALQQGLQVERRPAGDDGDAAAGAHVGDGGVGQLDPPGCRESRPQRGRRAGTRVGHVHEMVRHLAAKVGRRLGGPDVHPAVHLHRVG